MGWRRAAYWADSRHEKAGMVLRVHPAVRRSATRLKHNGFITLILGIFPDRHWPDVMSVSLYRCSAYLELEAWSVNSVATREKYLRILIHRLGLGMQPLWAWMAWMRAISVAMSLMGRTKKQKTRPTIIKWISRSRPAFKVIGNFSVGPDWRRQKLLNIETLLWWSNRYRTVVGFSHLQLKSMNRKYEKPTLRFFTTQ